MIKPNIEVFFILTDIAINQLIYLEQSVQKTLIPLINEHHSNGKYLFRFDLANIHYEKISVMYYMDGNKINFVKKLENLQNVSKSWPI